MNARELKDLFVSFFVSKGHREIPPARLVPENDPSTLFTSSGIQPLVPYFLGQPHSYGKRLVDVQNCIRTGDIDEVGDTVHHTFFEMLGNWSLGDYFKKEIIPWSFEFLTKILNIPVEKLAVSVFAGDDDAPRDDEAARLWLEQGIKPPMIAYLPKANNWWGPPGITGPCGTDTEMFYWTKKSKAPETFNPQDQNWVEIWNDVLIQYFKNDQGKFEKLVQNNVDTGMGVERTLAVLNGFSDNYLTSIWQPIIKKIEDISGQKYSANPQSFRIIADHIRASVFIIADGIEPGNKEAGYVLRRLIRRSIRQAKLLGIESNFCQVIATSVLDNQDNYAGIYPELNLNRLRILDILNNEEIKFRKTLNKGLNEINKLIVQNHNLTGKEAFDLYQSFGFPVEMIREELIKNNLTLDQGEFEKYREQHISLSRTLSAGKFKSGLADNTEIITKYHTATHLLHAALRKILGEHVQQSGSNITGERLRFDFSHDDKLTPDQLTRIQTSINDQIKADLKVSVTTMSFIQAKKDGALAFFGAKYPEMVTVYQIGDFSREVCTGPHVEHTGILGKFKIIKEESAGSGKRRIYAVLEDN